MKLLLATCRGRATAAAAAIRELIGADRNKESTREEEEEEVLSLSKHIDQLSVLPKNEEKKYKGLVGDGGGEYETPRQFLRDFGSKPGSFSFLFDFFF
jgi:hypothetical protein